MATCGPKARGIRERALAAVLGAIAREMGRGLRGRVPASESSEVERRSQYLPREEALRKARKTCVCEGWRGVVVV